MSVFYDSWNLHSCEKIKDLNMRNEQQNNQLVKYVKDVLIPEL